MANDNLRTALENAGLSPEELAEIVEVDIRTVRRWLAGKPPYRRHRGKIARALDTSEQHLWPDLAREPANDGATPTNTITNEIVAAYPRADDLNAPTTETLIHTATQQIDLLDNTLKRLLDRPGVPGLLISKANHGCRIRILLARPCAYLTPLLNHDRIQIRATRASATHQIHRVDDDMLITLRLTSQDEPPPPLIHLKHRADDALFGRLAQHFETVWENAGQPIRSAQDINSYLSDDGTNDENPPTFAEQLPTKPPAGGPSPLTARPRKWPRRPVDRNS